MPSVTGLTSVDGDLLVVTVPAGESVQVWSLSLYCIEPHNVEVLCGERVVATVSIAAGGKGCQVAARGTEPLIQGLRGEDLSLRLAGFDVVYNVAYTLV